MNCSLIKGFLSETFDNYFKCKIINDDSLGIETPFTYPDGDVIEVFLYNRYNKMLLTDFGETLRYLGSYDLSIKNNTKRQHLIDDIISGTDIKFIKGNIYKYTTLDNLAESIFDLSQTIIRVCDLLYTIKGTSAAGFAEEVRDLLVINKFNFEENYTVDTESGNRYEFDFGVEVKDKIKLIKLINPPSQITHKPKLERIVSTWADLEAFSSFRKNQRITLLDDSYYTWNNNHLKLVEYFSIVHKWSDQEKFIKSLNESVA
jgi:hypothetical protein